MKKKIMFVDDEKQILRSLNRLFMDSGYEMVFMDSGEAAAAYLEENTVNMVVSDIRMPGMSGFDLLRQVKAKHPETLRIALSGYTESNAIYKALEENVSKMYLFKPWNNAELRGIIEQMFALEAVLSEKKILDMVNNLEDLPTLPIFYTKISQMIQEDEDVERIAKLIESDQASATKILRIANSAFYGAKTGSIVQAIMYIGLINVKNIVLTNAIFNIEGPNGDIITYLWENATLTNRYTTLIYQNFLGHAIPNIFASSGLLHNIGMVVFLSRHKADYSVTKGISIQAKLDILEEEQKRMNLTHQELGGYLLNWWEMPLPIIEAALYHHMPMSERVINRELICAVHLASVYTWERGEYKIPFAPQIEECCSFLNIDKEELWLGFSEADARYESAKK